ncbi:class I SAM-dependent methyltransferase [Flammeovirgaceae bacterium SG7u.111]|nr:class I SAM-dependent methyltransferase [Flammeovirgaceae bacterium SG7u.132]WPO38249.1 class I SAM-dependent methyltransferase [Flammeovirgaceae bacterium SG7u.111]
MKNKDQWQNKKYRYIEKSNKYEVRLENVNPRSVYLNSVIIPVYAKIIKQHVKGELLDLGCGLVPFYSMYKDLIKNNTCVDWENSDHKTSFLDVFADLNQPLPLESEKYDTVLLTDVLEHIYKPHELIKEIERVLLPNGKLIITVPFFYWIHEPPFDFYRYTKFSLQRFCEDNNLSIVVLEPYGGYPDILLDLLNKKLVSNIYLAKAFMGITALFRNSKWFANWRKRTSESYPLGYCLVAKKK